MVPRLHIKHPAKTGEMTQFYQYGDLAHMGCLNSFMVVTVPTGSGDDSKLAP
jgi:hypothetical protein